MKVLWSYVVCRNYRKRCQGQFSRTETVYNYKRSASNNRSRTHKDKEQIITPVENNHRAEKTTRFVQSLSQYKS